MTDKDLWEERARYWQSKLPNLAAALRSEELQKQCESIDQMPFEDGTMWGWLAAIDIDSYNYFPKKIPYSRFDEAITEGLFIHASESEAQKECDALNSM